MDLQKSVVEMTCCTDLHKQYEKFVNGAIQVGELPDWMHVEGKVAWYVYQGPYSELGIKALVIFGANSVKPS